MHMDLVLSNIDLLAAEIQLVNEVGREQTLARALHPVLDRCDNVLIDCQPSLGLLTVNGLARSDGVAIPTEREYCVLRGMALPRWPSANTASERAQPSRHLPTDVSLGSMPWDGWPTRLFRPKPCL